MNQRYEQSGLNELLEKDSPTEIRVRNLPFLLTEIFTFKLARLWNLLLTECFPLTYDLNDFNSIINRYLLIVGSFYTDFPYALVFQTLKRM